MSETPQKPVIVLADDLTGAAEIAAFVSSQGLPALLTWCDALPSEIGRITVVIDTETRNLEDTQAQRRITEILGQERFPDGDIYVKIDSTLRGPIQAILTILSSWKSEESGSSILLAPAYPRMKRTTKGGVQYVNAIPVSEGPAGTDPVAPASTSHLENLLPGGDFVLLEAPASVSDLSVHELAAVLEVHRGAGRHVLFDAALEADLELLGRALKHVPFPIIVGSGGLARHLWSEPTPADIPRVHAPILIVAGSFNPVVRTQLARLERGVSCHHLGHPPDIGSLSGLLPQALIISTPKDRTQPEYAAAYILDALEEVIQTVRPGALLLTGGDTALNVLKRLKATALEIRGELLPGVPLGSIAGGPFSGLPVATKAGGFGEEDLLQRAVQRLSTPYATKARAF